MAFFCCHFDFSSLKLLEQLRQIKSFLFYQETGEEPEEGQLTGGLIIENKATRVNNEQIVETKL